MKKIGLILLVLVAIVGAVAWYFYGAIYSVNTAFDSGKKELLLPNDQSLEVLLTTLVDQGILSDVSNFERTAALKKFEKAKHGRYLVKAKTNNNELINMLRGGWQSPVKLTFTNARVPEDLAGKLSHKIQPDSLAILSALRNPNLHTKYGFNSETFRTMFLPNTYEVYWSISPEELVARLAKEYKKFWTPERTAKAKKHKLSQSEVTTLASIVLAETAKSDEASRVAGVYLNRLRLKMPLQADPTLVYAAGDFSIRRVLDKHKQIKSPYNTYLNACLPPGPINYPSTTYIDAVLNAETHKFLYFCAREDFSGYHTFAKTLSQHNANARRYQSALNKSGIYR